VKLVLASIGRLKAGPERDLASRYIDRAVAAARSVGLTGVEQRELEESRARRPEDRKAEEARALRQVLPAGGRLILLDERGKSISSEVFAADIGRARDEGTSSYVLAIGGPDGFDPTLRGEAALVLAFGAMTWPHQLARIMAAEQIYRALTILSGHPYHRA
jgi:23S rRNA (pseudouridine1915-N3)-methyltransferase